MKKQIIIFLISLMVAATMCLCVSCVDENTPVIGPIIHPSTRPSYTLGTTKGPDAPPVVRLYVCGKEDPAVYEALAERYTQATGVECQVLTGNLSALMESDTPPTLFCIHNPMDAAARQDTLYDLTGEAVLEQLYSPALVLTQDGKATGIAMDIHAYGVIYNAGMLAQAGYTRSDIVDGEDFRHVVETITANKMALGFSAFCAPNIPDTHYAMLLANAGGNEAFVRDFLDLNLNNSLNAKTPLESFTLKRTAFYMGGDWEFDSFSQVGFHNLDFLPFYTENGATIPCISNCYWSVNADSGEANIAATLEFLNWLVTPGETGTPVDELGFFAPFRTATGGDNLFQRRILRKYLSESFLTLSWSFQNLEDPTWESRLRDAMAAYIAKPGDETWAQVAALLG